MNAGNQFSSDTRGDSDAPFPVQTPGQPVTVTHGQPTNTMNETDFFGGPSGGFSSPQGPPASNPEDLLSGGLGDLAGVQFSPPVSKVEDPMSQQPSEPASRSEDLKQFYAEEASIETEK